jgi:hypothetical protein
MIRIVLEKGKNKELLKKAEKYVYQFIEQK